MQMTNYIELSDSELDQVFGGYDMDSDYDSDSSDEGQVVVVTGKRCTADTDADGCGRK
jgi:hypothetical protein